MFNKRNWVAILILSLALSINAQDKKTIAVLDFDANGISESDVKSLTNRVGNLLFRSNKFNLIERTSRELSITHKTVLSIFKKLSKGVKESFVKTIHPKNITVNRLSEGQILWIKNHPQVGNVLWQL